MCRLLIVPFGRNAPCVVPREDDELEPRCILTAAIQVQRDDFHVVKVRPFAETSDDFRSVDDERLGRHLTNDNERREARLCVSALSAVALGPTRDKPSCAMKRVGLRGLRVLESLWLIQTPRTS